MLSPQAAQERLHEALGEPPGYWARFLANNRRSDRSPGVRIPFEHVSGRPLYLAEAIETFIDGERARRVGRHGLAGRPAEVMRAFGIGEGGSRTGRPFDAQICAQIDEATGEGFVQLVTPNPLAVYRLTIDQARALATDLIREASDAATQTFVPGGTS